MRLGEGRQGRAGRRGLAGEGRQWQKSLIRVGHRQLACTAARERSIPEQCRGNKGPPTVRQRCSSSTPTCAMSASSMSTSCGVYSLQGGVRAKPPAMV